MTDKILSLFRVNEWVIFFAVFGAGCFFRLYKFASIPFGLNHDAAFYGLSAIELGQKLPSYYPHAIGWSGETLFSYWILFVFQFFGINPTILRLASIAIGIFSLPTFYLLAKKIQGSTTALVSLFFISISGWHITMSKAGWSVILVPLFQSITILFLLKALETNKRIFWILSGALLAATLNSYAAARITPLIVIVTLLLWIRAKKISFKMIRLNLLFFGITCLIFMLPLLSFIISNWGIYTSRMQSLSVVNRISAEQSLKPLYDNFAISLGMLHFRANGDDFFVKEPLLEIIPGILFILGLAYLLFTIKKAPSQLIFFWLVLGFIPGILSVPNGNHDFSILIPTYLIVGYGGIIPLIIFQKIVVSYKNIGIIVVAVLCILAASISYDKYLSPGRSEIFGFYPETTVVGKFINAKKDNYDFYLTDNYPRDALTFITYQGGNPYEKHYAWLERGSEFLNTQRLGNRGIIFLMFDNPENNALAMKIAAKFPFAQIYLLPYRDAFINRAASLVVEVPPLQP